MGLQDLKNAMMSKEEESTNKMLINSKLNITLICIKFNNIIFQQLYRYISLSFDSFYINFFLIITRKLVINILFARGGVP